jgi:hypothetical protein
MVTYELKSFKLNAYLKNVDGHDTSSVTIGMITGVVGCPNSYGMVAGDTSTFNIANASTKTQNQIDAELVVAMNAFVANKYPST